MVITSLDIPANNCAILQKRDDLELLPAGQHYITNPNVTLRGMFTLGENQLEMPTKDMCVITTNLFLKYDLYFTWILRYTRDQVPVSLTIYMKWQLMEPLKVCIIIFELTITMLTLVF